MQKCVLNEMAVPVEVLVITSLPLSIFAGWDHDAHALSGGLLDDDITVVALVGQQVLGTESFTKQPPAKAGGFELRTESPDTRRLNDAS